MPFRIVFAIAALCLCLAGTKPALAMPLSPAKGLGAVTHTDDVVRISRWHRHPRPYLRYRLPPDIFRPRCWMNRWGDVHCPYGRRLTHRQKRHCRTNRRGDLLCPF